MSTAPHEQIDRDTTESEPASTPDSEAEASTGSGTDADTATPSSDGVDSASGGSAATTPKESPVAHLEREGDIAADYLEALLDIADLDGDIDLDVENDRAIVSIVGADLQDLVGAGGRGLDALQELTRLAVLRETGERSRLMLDIAGTRARRRVELTALGTEAAERARTSNEAVRLAPMNPFERKVVHDAVAAAGLRSESEGVEPERRVVVHPA